MRRIKQTYRATGTYENCGKKFELYRVSQKPQSYWKHLLSEFQWRSILKLPLSDRRVTDELARVTDELARVTDELARAQTTNKHSHGLFVINDAIFFKIWISLSVAAGWELYHYNYKFICSFESIWIVFVYKRALRYIIVSKKVLNYWVPIKWFWPFWLSLFYSSSQSVGSTMRSTKKTKKQNGCQPM